jgi:hypothetical protein
MTIAYTLYRSIYDVAHPVPHRDADFQAVANRLRTHTPVTAKDKAPGFGPYTLAPTATPCLEHRVRGVVRPFTQAHRCDRCVTAITLAVFDADVGSTDDVEECDSYLNYGRVGRIWYTTFSWVPEAATQSMRLVLPVSEPVPPYAWPYVRGELIRNYRIPADPKKCSGASHFYYAPARSVDGPAGVYEYTPGGAVDVGLLIAAAPPASASLRESAAAYRTTLEDDPDDEPGDVEPVRAALRRRMKYFSRFDKNNAEQLRRVLYGVPLAEDGSRNETTFRTCGLVAHAAPEASLATLIEVMSPSLVSMREEGSSLTREHLVRFLSTGLEAARAKVARDEAFAKDLGSWGTAAKEALTKR